MCWNKSVSMNTFLLGLFAVLFAYFNNVINIYQSLTLMSVVSMQLIEYFLWSNLDNRKKNIFYSNMAEALVVSQPIFALLTLTHPFLKYICVSAYLVFLVIVRLFYKVNTVNYTSIGKNGHLRWNWLSTNPIKIFVYLCGLFIPIYFWKQKLIFIIMVLTYIITKIMYASDQTWGSIWCWSSNCISLYLIYLVFRKLF